MAAIGTPYFLGVWKVKPGKETEFMDTWKAFAMWTRGHHDWVKDVTLLRDPANPQRFFSFGPWRRLADLEDWKRTPEYIKAINDLKELCDEVQPNTLTCVAYLGAEDFVHG
jgi:heme-degrading monooxygenase HmoA